MAHYSRWQGRFKRDAKTLTSSRVRIDVQLSYLNRFLLLLVPRTHHLNTYLLGQNLRSHLGRWNPGGPRRLARPQRAQRGKRGTTGGTRAAFQMEDNIVVQSWETPQNRWRKNTNGTSPRLRGTSVTLRESVRRSVAITGTARRDVIRMILLRNQTRRISVQLKIKAH